MGNTTSFTLTNDSKLDLDIIHEPEGFEFSLPTKEEITIETGVQKESIALNVSIEDGKIVIAIFNENSLYTITYKGVDVFEKYK